MPRVRPRTASLVGAVAVTGALAVPAFASASILVNYPSNVSCGGRITTGVWDRPDGQMTSRRVKIQVRSARGYVLWSKTVTATSSWRYWRYSGRCGRTYRVSYSNAQFGTVTYRVKVRD
jgi:hypothetical protein